MLKPYSLEKIILQFHNKHFKMSRNPWNRIKYDIYVWHLEYHSGGLRFKCDPVFYELMSVWVCVCTSAFLHISKSATTVECDFPSFSHLSSLPLSLPHPVRALWPGVKEVRGYWVEKSAQDRGRLHKCTWHTPPYSKQTQTCACLFTLLCSNGLAHKHKLTHICTQ